MNKIAACLIIFIAVILVTPRLGAAQENGKVVRFESNAEHSLNLPVLPDSAHQISRLMVGGYFATTGRERESKVLEGAVIGLTAGALAGGVITILGNESGNLGLNLFALALPGALLGALVGAVW